jgi:ATP-binding cassette subfamily F protein 3
MFTGEDVFKPLGVLSGGERNRYAMAKMLVSPANMLLLDEPTNHLDIRAKDVLLDAIRKFTGTVLFVSHDRYFIDGLATRVFEVEERRVHVYPGNYEDYLWRKQGGPEKVTASLTNAAVSVTAPVANVAPAAAEAEKVPVKRLNPIKLKQLEERLAFVEDEMPRVDDAISVGEEQLGRFVSAEESQRVAAELDGLREKRGKLLTEWEELALALEEQETAV